MPISLAVLAAGLTFLNQQQCGSIGAHPFTPKVIGASGKSFTNVACAKPRGGPGVAIAPQRNGAVIKVSQKRLLKTRSIFSGHDDSGLRQLEYGFGGAIAPLASTR